MNGEQDLAGLTAQARVAASRRLHPGFAGRPALDRLTALTQRILGVASAQVSLVTEVATTVGSAGVPAAMQRELPLSESLCAYTAARGRPWVVNDTRSDPVAAGLIAVTSGAAGSFLGVPVKADDHSVVGALCAYDPAPRLWTQDDVDTVEALAVSVAAELELAALTRDFDANRARWDLAIESAGVGSFDWDLRTGQLSWDAALIELFGYSDDDVFAETIDAFNARVHPSDLPVVTEALQRSIDTIGDFEAEYRVVLADGTHRLVQARGRALASGGGATADRLLGAAWDVSATKLAEDRAARLVEAMPIAYLRVDSEGKVRAGNSLAERLLRAHRLDLLDRDLWSAVPELAHSRLREVCDQVLGTRVALTRELEFAAPIAAWLELRVVPEAGGLSIFFTDITDRRLAQAHADTIATHNRHIAAALQQALLTRLPQRDDLVLGARYIPAATTDQVGGDWYDALSRADGTAALVIGDVSGHDIDAAGTMGQLRGMLRALLWSSSDSPATVTTALDRAISGLYDGALATAITAVVEPNSTDAAEGCDTVLRWCNAGHLPPVLVQSDGAVRLLDPPAELMLGVDATASRSDHVVPLAAGATVLLYTDGLIERRDTDLDSGLQRLTQSLGRHHQLPMETMLDRVVADLVDHNAEDDVALLAVQLRRPNLA